MKRRAILGIVLAGSATFAILGVATVRALTRAPATVTVSDAAAFARAIADREQAMTVRLAPGYYPSIDIIRKKDDPGPPLTVESADPNSRAVIGELDVANAAGVTLKHVDFERRAGQVGSRYIAIFRSAQGARLISSRFRGPLGGVPQPHEYGLMLRNSDDVRVEGSEFSGLRYGIGFIGGDRMAIVRNEFRDMQTDGIRGEGANDLLIAGNVIGDFSPAKGDHADGIQLWTNNQKTVNRRIVIRGNLVTRGKGAFIQGIFVRDTKSQLPLEDVEIANNLIVGGSFNGIALMSARNGVIRDNIVVGYPDQQSWIRLSANQGTRMTGNRSTRYVQQKSEGIVESGNSTIRQTRDARRINALISTWAAGNRDLNRNGRYLRELLAEGR